MDAGEPADGDRKKKTVTKKNVVCGCLCWTKGLGQASNPRLTLPFPLPSPPSLSPSLSLTTTARKKKVSVNESES